MPTEPSPLTEGLRAISNFMAGDATARETLRRVADLGLDALPGADMVGITMLLDGRPRTAVFTDEEASQIDSAQYETGIGPCLDAFRHKQVYRIDDMEQDHLWPPFSDVAASHGVRSVMSVPLVARHQGVGAINFYSRRSAAFSHDDVEVGIAFATQAALLLATSQTYWDSQLLEQTVGAATASGATIEQAKGILMSAEGCGPDEAFEILVRTSEREERNLREVAQEVVARTTRGAGRPGDDLA